MKITNLLLILTATTLGSFGIAAYCFKNSNVDKNQIAKAFQIQIDNSNDLEEVKESVQLPADQVSEIEVNAVNSNITIYDDVGSDIRIKFKGKTADKDARVFQYKLEDGRLKLDLVDASLRKSFFIQWDNDNMRGGEAGPELRIFLPKALKNLKVKNVSGDIKIKKVDIGDISLEQVGGGIRLEEVKAQSIYTTQVSGDNRLIRVLADKVDINSVSGDVKVEMITDNDYELKLSTMSGEVKNNLKTTHDAKGKMKISTVSGDIKIGIVRN